MTVRQMIRCMLIAAVVAAALALGFVIVAAGSYARTIGGADPVGASGALLAVLLAASAAVGFYYLLRL